MHWRSQWRVVVFVLAVVVLSSVVFAQTDQPSPSQPPQIDETAVNVPTTLSLKEHHSYFWLTSRFARDLRRGSFGQLAEDLFSLDNGAVIALEFLQLNFGNNFATTPGMIARGGAKHSVFMGFNLSRKF
jgi:hypothetical protein